MESVDVAAHQLAGISHVEVVFPSALRERLRQHGEVLLAANC